MSACGKNNVVKIRTLTILFVAIFLLNISIATAAQEKRGRTPRPRVNKNQQRDAKNAKAAQENAKKIDAALLQMLTDINAQQYPDKKDNAETAEILKTSKRSLKDFVENNQCQYFMLQAWNDYFTGEKDRALKVSTKAYKTNPKNNDAKLTHIAMAILNNKKPISIDPEKAAKKKPAKKNTRRQAPARHGGPMGGMGPMGMMGPAGGHAASASFNATSGEILQLNEYAMANSQLGKTVEPMQVDCLNSTVFSYDPQNTVLCALIWNTELSSTDADYIMTTDPNDSTKQIKKMIEKKRPAAKPRQMGMGYGMMGPMGRQNNKKEVSDDPLTRQMDAFGQLFADNFDNYATQFVAVNVDKSNVTRSEVLKKTMENPWPWAQVIAKDQMDNLTIDVPKMPEGISLPPATLVIADSNGSVRYAGPAEGFLAPLLLNDIAPRSAKTAKRKVTPIKTIAKSSVKTADTKTQKSQDDEEFDPQAEKLLANATQFIKMGRFTSYKKGVNMCRQVINGYPGTKYQQQAREILRGVPEHKRKQYGITDADLGQ